MSSLPQMVPGRGDCPPGYKLTDRPTQPGASRECVPVGPEVPLGGWRETAPGTGAGYPPTAGQAASALFSAVLGAGGPAKRYMEQYGQWVKGGE